MENKLRAEVSRAEANLTEESPRYHRLPNLPHSIDIIDNPKKNTSNTLNTSNEVNIENSRNKIDTEEPYYIGFYVSVIILLSFIIILNLSCIVLSFTLFTSENKCNQINLVIQNTFFIMLDILIITVISKPGLYKQLKYSISFVMLFKIGYFIIIMLNFNGLTSCSIYDDLITKILYINMGYSFSINFAYFVIIIVKFFV
jgi:hypothetical protein